MTDEREPEFEELDQALEALREGILARSAAPAPEPFDWQSSFTDLRRRMSAFGMSERSGEVDEFGMDELVLRRLRPLLDLLHDHYWRVDVGGEQRLPEAGPCLLVANRSGILPYDGLMLAHAVERARSAVGRPRFLVADWLITLPFVQPYLARLGGVRACRENAERLLEAGRFVIAFPEGVKGAAKVFRERYRLKRFGRGGVLPLPSKWVIRIGKPLALDHLEPDAASDELLVSRLTEELRSQIQSLVEIGLSDRESTWG
jgi:1-acyl-sn-glycerol-3-phosphate acyltransferase